MLLEEDYGNPPHLSMAIRHTSAQKMRRPKSEAATKPDTSIPQLSLTFPELPRGCALHAIVENISER
jgi:hypothetical protein